MKEPWQMTQAEYIAARRAEPVSPFWGAISEENLQRLGKQHHQAVIKRSLERGKPVPPEVLAEYPELVATLAEQIRRYQAGYVGGPAVAYEATDMDIRSDLAANLTCRRCGHKWLARVPHPVRCPVCGSPRWDSPRKGD